MKYTDSQISKAKARYNAFLIPSTVSLSDIENIGKLEATRRVDNHNSIINAILSGDKSLEREWKIFFLTEEVKSDFKKTQRKNKLAANKNASADILKPIQDMRKLGAFGKWLNNSSNPFRKEHFNKKYTQESVDAFLATL